MKIHKIRNVVVFLGIFGLLAGSLYGTSHTLARKSLHDEVGQSSNILRQTILSSTESNSSSDKQKPDPTQSPSSTSSASSSPSSIDASTPSSPSATQPSTTSSSSKENLSLLTQVQNSAHNRLSLQSDGMICRICHIVSANSYSLRNAGWESCGSCHVNSSGNPIPGNTVQHPQFQMIQGVAIGDILPMPSYKYKYMKDNFSCTDCHITNANKHDFLVSGVAIIPEPEGIPQGGTDEMDYQAFRTIFNQDKCAVCHPSSADMVDRVKNEQENISQRLADLKPIYIEWSGKVATMNPEDPKVLAFKNGATYYTFVEADGSKGVHNFPYAQTLLDKAESYWTTLEE